MNEQIGRAMRRSSEDFLRLVWPAIGARFGEIIPVETVTANSFAKELDVRAGIDAWLICVDGTMRGLASRVQWNDRSYDTFTVRMRSRYGGPTEYDKRRREIATTGAITPHYFAQAYISEDRTRLLAAALTRMRDVIAARTRKEARVTELVAIEKIRPGLVPTGFAEQVLERSSTIDDPMALWDGATSLAGLAQKWNGHGREKNEIKTAQMFVEIELGQRLGPRPEWGNQTTAQGIPHAVSGIPQQRVSELQRFYGHRDLLIEAVRNGKRSRRTLLLAVDEAEAVEPDDTELDIRHGDFRDQLGDIEPGSVTLILTDPPYPTEYLPLWSALGDFAEKALSDGGSLVAYCGQAVMPEALDRLSAHLRYWWTLALLNSAGTQMIPGKFVSAGWKPILWYVKDHRINQSMLPDRINGSPPRKTVPTGDDGTWAQGLDELKPIISALTAPGDLIVDPFAGSGTTGLAALSFGRRFVGATL